jgi:hypothetical protein
MEAARRLLRVGYARGASPLDWFVDVVEQRDQLSEGVSVRMSRRRGGEGVVPNESALAF